MPNVFEVNEESNEEKSMSQITSCSKDSTDNINTNIINLPNLKNKAQNIKDDEVKLAKDLSRHVGSYSSYLSSTTMEF